MVVYFSNGLVQFIRPEVEENSVQTMEQDQRANHYQIGVRITVEKITSTESNLIY